MDGDRVVTAVRNHPGIFEVVTVDKMGRERKRFRAYIRDPQGRQRSKTFSGVRAAQSWKDSQRVAVRDGNYVDPASGRVTLQALYAELHEAREYAPATLALHGELWKRLGPDLGHRSLNAIDAALVDRVLGKIEAPAMREKARLLLSALFGHAEVTRGRMGNPARRKRVPSTRASRKAAGGSEKAAKRYLGPQELARLLEEVSERFRAPVHLMARVGLRPGEAYALRVGKFDPLKRTLLIDTSASGDTKTGEARVVHVPAVVAEELTAHIKRWSDWEPDSLIFRGERGAMIHPENFRRRVLGPAAERAGIIPGLRVNDLRHSAVSSAIAQGANVYQVQRMVGHAKPSITLDVYGSLWDHSQEELAERLDAAIRAELEAAEPGAEVVVLPTVAEGGAKA